MNRVRFRIRAAWRLFFGGPIKLIEFAFRFAAVALGIISIGKNFRKLTNKHTSKKRILHIIPKSYLLQHPMHGSNKDIASFDAMLSDGDDVQIDHLYVDRGRHSLLDILDARNRKDLHIKKYGLIIINIPGNNGLLAMFLRIIKSKKGRIAYRAHNADVPHRLDKAKVPGVSRVKKNGLYFKAFQSLISDRMVAYFVDYVLSISRYDAFYYWSKMGRSDVLHLPYMPRNYKAKPDLSLRTFVLSIGAAKGSEFALHQEENFYKNVRNINLKDGFSFVQIGGSNIQAAPPNVLSKKFVKDIDYYQKRARVICLCSSLGRGTKTKVADAVASGVPVILEEEMFWKLDVELAHGCVPYGSNSKYKTFEEALNFVIQNPNWTMEIAKYCAPAIYKNIRKQIETTLYSLKRGVFDLKYVGKKQPKPKEVDLLTVLYEKSEKFLLSVKLMHRNSPHEKLTWHIVINTHDMQSWASFRAALTKAAPSIKFRFHKGFPNFIGEENSGSINHSAGLHVGMREVSNLGARNIIILDPDIYLLSEGFILKLFEKLQKKEIRLAGTISEPGILTHNIDYPSVHFLAMNLSILQQLQMDFSPTFLQPKKIKSRARKYMAILKPGQDKMTLYQQMRHLVYYLMVWGINGDTGYRLVRFRKLKILIFNMYKNPRGTKTLRQFDRFHPLFMKHPKFKSRIRYLRESPKRPKRLSQFGAMFKVYAIVPDKFVLLHQHTTSMTDDAEVIQFMRSVVEQKNQGVFENV